MRLISVKCTNCGVTLNIDNTRDMILCPYCDTPYIIKPSANTNPTKPAEDSVHFDIRDGVLVKYTGSSSIVIIPDSVSVIGKGAFKRCTQLTKVQIPGSVHTIKAHAFSRCTNLTEITLPSTITSLGIGAFAYCENLKKMDIPGSIPYIEKRAFYHCHNLSEITIGRGVISIGPYAFANCFHLVSVSLPMNTIRLGSSAFGWCTSLKEITIPDNVLIAKKYSTPFIGCDNLQIHASVEWKTKNWLCHPSLFEFR